MRYRHVLELIHLHKPKRIVEVGTWNGIRAMEMVAEALKHNKEVHYIGFDLFEDGTAETDARELNVKARCSLDGVAKRLEQFKSLNQGFSFDLHKGDTRQTLNAGPIEADFAFIDGGHSVETIKNDFNALRHVKVIALDDFYEADAAGKSPDISRYGVNNALGDTHFAALPQADPVLGGGLVRIIVVPPNAYPTKQRLVVKTRNCVAHENIRANIGYASQLVSKWIPKCEFHDKTAVFVSGGPSAATHLDEIRERSARGEHIVCVKHSHDLLIENGIIPWAAMLLDPRSHVKDFIENPHPGVLYFVASMCHPTTLDRLLEKQVNVWGYHAYVGAEEPAWLKKIGFNDFFMVQGGSTSAVRGILVLRTLGFRNFALYGYDSCYWDERDFSEKTKIGHPKYIKIEVNGREFVTDLELIAQVQDFEHLIKTDTGISIECCGDGIIPHIWMTGRRINPNFEDVFGRLPTPGTPQSGGQAERRGTDGDSQDLSGKLQEGLGVAPAVGGDAQPVAPDVLPEGQADQPSVGG